MALWRTWLGALALTGVLAISACGGGRTAVIGLGNDGNRILEKWDLADEVAEVLADDPNTPRITDETISAIFQTILDNAKSGDAEAALIVLRLAEHQRKGEAG